MKSTKPTSDKALRQKAEEILKKKQYLTPQPLSESDALRLVHELQVHQIELELINAELMAAKDKAASLAQDKYVELYDFAPSGYLTLTKEGKIIELNLTAANMLGMQRGTIINNNILSFIAESTKSIFKRCLEKIFFNKDNASCEIVLKPHIGTLIYVLVTGKPDVNSKQCLVNMVDITERRQAETSLIDQQSLYQELFDNMEEGFSLQEIILDDDGHPVDFRFLAVNKAYERHTGMSPSTCIGHTMLEIMPQADKHQIERYGHVALTGEPMAYDYYSNSFKRHLHVKSFSPRPGCFATV